ncbi:MAG: CHAT domain-containing protein [Stigonema ocellatum SAG 48.90 = DSM 106950]|nr:CHAT domain-containing protein [Stigonema ocellatum SAG 48.90 = DSM 106950]
MSNKTPKNLNKIYNLRLPVELVTMSACKTGLGQNVQGEGLIGLTRGFMYAGAKRVLVSLCSFRGNRELLTLNRVSHGLSRGIETRT